MDPDQIREILDSESPEVAVRIFGEKGLAEAVTKAQPRAGDRPNK
jgi:hypothetical protein